MIKRIELREIAKARIKDAEVLLMAKRYDGAVYICGYAIELGPKARICRTLKWPCYPSTNKEFADYRRFKTHDLDVLLHLSGIEEKIKNLFGQMSPTGILKRDMSLWEKYQNQMLMI